MTCTTHLHAAMQRTVTLSSLLATLLLGACAAKPPQGYGAADQSTAVQAQQQLEKAEQSTQLDPKQTYLGLIVRMQQAQQWYASLAHTEAYERQYGTSPQLSLLRADAQRNTGQLAQAQRSYTALLSDKNTEIVGRAHRGLGLLLASQRQYDQAVVQLDKARALNPIDADVLSDLAYAHMLNGKLDAAQVPVMQAAQLSPNDARVQLNLVLFLLASGENSQATHLLQRLQQPQAKNTPALIDAKSIQTLQAQLAAVQKAMDPPTVGNVAPSPTLTPLNPPASTTPTESPAVQTSATASPAPQP